MSWNGNARKRERERERQSGGLQKLSLSFHSSRYAHRPTFFTPSQGIIHNHLSYHFRLPKMHSEVHIYEAINLSEMHTGALSHLKLIKS